MKIIEWNIRGFYHNLENFQILLYDQKPDVICLNETWFKNSDNYSHPKYNIHKIIQNDGFGGIATFIKKIPYSLQQIHLTIFAHISAPNG